MSDAQVDGLLSSPAVDSDGKVLIPPPEMVRSFFNRYDLDLSGTMNTTNELKQLTVNLIVNLQVETTVDKIETGVKNAGDMEELQWGIDEFKQWFLKEFEFSSKTYLDELTSATQRLNGSVEELQAKLLDEEDAAKLEQLEAQLQSVADKQALLAQKVRDMNSTETELRDKAEAALEKKRLAEDARERKYQRELKARQAAIDEGSAACKELSTQIETLQAESLDTEDPAALADINKRLNELIAEQAEMSAKVRALNDAPLSPMSPSRSPRRSPSKTPQK
jgi:chromosome segregation ATPase